MTSLEPGHYVALHGMPVAGKSVLAAEAVRDPNIALQVSICTYIIRKLLGAYKYRFYWSTLPLLKFKFQFFPDGIFWFRVGIIESREKLLNRLKILCEKLDAQNVPSSIEHAQEILRR